MSLIIVLQNTTDLAPISDYKYTVMVGDGGSRSKVLETGIVTQHPRIEGWQALVKRFLHFREESK